MPQSSRARARAEPGSLAYSAKEAKRQGKQAITIRHIFDEIGSEAPLDGFLRAYATVLATPVGASVQTTDKYYVYTWHFFHVLRILAQPPSPSVPGCHVLPPRALVADEIAIPLVAGTAVIEGVAITMDSDESHATFKPGQQYLFLSIRCPSGVALLLQGRLDIFEVMPDGRIVVPTTPWFRYMQDVMKLGTIDRLTEQLKALSVGQ